MRYLMRSLYETKRHKKTQYKYMHTELTSYLLNFGVLPIINSLSNSNTKPQGNKSTSPALTENTFYRSERTFPSATMGER